MFRHKDKELKLKRLTKNRNTNKERTKSHYNLPPPIE